MAWRLIDARRWFVDPRGLSFQPDGLRPASGLSEVRGDQDSRRSDDIDVLAVGARRDSDPAGLLGDVELLPEAVLGFLGLKISRQNQEGERKRERQHHQNNCAATDAD